MNQMKLTRQVGIDAALRYLKSKQALGKLGTPTPVIGRNVCIWVPFRHSTLAFSLEPLRLERR